MLLLAGRPEPAGPANTKDWKICGDPVPHPLDPRLQVIPYPINSSTWLTIDAAGLLGFSSVAGTDTEVQVRGNLLECERAGSMVFKCIPGLI